MGVTLNMWKIIVLLLSILTIRAQDDFSATDTPIWTIQSSATEIPLTSIWVDPLSATEPAPASLAICDVCTCGEIRSDEDVPEIVLNIQCSELDRINYIPDLNRIEWPENPNTLKICVTFEGLGLTNVESLPPNSLIETLSFTNNIIKTTWPGAFSDLRSLRKLSFSQNELSEITPDMFTNLLSLEELDLSYNKLTEFNKLDFAGLKNLRKLNLHNNQLRKVPAEELENNKKLEDLDLSKNAIFNLQFKNPNSSLLKTVKRLNLSGNKIPNVLTDMFPENSVEIIDLSNNIIANIEDAAFKKCTHLRELNLASNQLTSVFSLPNSLLSVTLAHNHLQDWPTFPNGITYVDVSSNQLIDLYDQNYADFDQLEVLKLSANQLPTLQLTTRLPKLYTLDLSYNLLQEIPPTINSEMLPALGELRLDGNPIQNVYFQEKISLRALYLNDLREVSSIGNNATINVNGRSDSENDCVQLYVSNSPALIEISEGAFNGTPICLLDLSYNNLTKLPQGLVEWGALKEGLNLQGNPWDCSCDMQWFLDELLPKIHMNYPHYLTELRCETPRARQGLRMVHWLNWGEQVLCTNGYSRSGPNQSYMLEPRESGTILSGASSLTLVLGGCIILSLLILVALSAYLVRTRKRRYAVRKATLRKRQSAQDRKSQNGNHKEQFTALNRT